MATSSGNCDVKIRSPEAFSFIPEEWMKWKARFIRYMSITGNDIRLEDADKVNCLLYCMGEKAEDIIIQFGELTYKSSLEKFDRFFNPKRNVIYERYKFNARIQVEGERFDEFITELYKLAENCEYGALKEELIRDRVIIGIKDKTTSERMLLKNDLTLKEATLMCKQAEILREENKRINGNCEQQETNVNNMSKKIKTTPIYTNKCWFCGKERHTKENCPAAKVTCYNCKRIGHFANLCRSKSVRQVEESKVTFEVSLCEKREKYMIDVGLFRGNTLVDNVNFLIDTGADITAIPETVADKNGLQLMKCADTVRGPDGAKLNVIGTVENNLKLVYKSSSYDGKLYVIKGLKTASWGVLLSIV